MSHEKTGPDTLTLVRQRAAGAIRIVAGVFAAVLVFGAILIALGDSINRDNIIARVVLDVAGFIDGPLSRVDGILQFDGDNAERWEALTNWGLAAVAWYLIGRVLSRVVQGR